MVARGKEDLRTLLPKLSLQRLMTWKVSLVEAAVGDCATEAAASATALRPPASLVDHRMLPFFLVTELPKLGMT